MAKLTKRLIDSLKAEGGELVVWDDDLPGFGIRVKLSGAKSFCVQYRAVGISKRLTVGRYGVLTPQEGRAMAQALLAQVAQGGNPVEERQRIRMQPTVEALFERYLTEHAALKKKASSVHKDRQWISRFILPRLGKMKIEDVSRADVASLHHALRDTPYQANRTLEVLKKAFNLAEKWGLRTDGSNPCRHVEKFKERRRERFLAPDELASLGQALDEIEREQSELPAMLTLVRLLTMTGARLGEIQNLRWQNVDLEAGVLRLSDSKTGPKQIPLGGPARDLLANLPRDQFNEHVCPGLKPGAPLVGVHRAWYRMRLRAGLPDLRLHDLRHAWASLAASSGLSLPIIGAVLGHRRAETTNRYSHFLQEPLKQAVDMVTVQIAEAMSKPVVPKVVNLADRKGSKD